MLHIKKRSMFQVLALYMFITPFLLNFMHFFLYIPSIIKYTIDIAWVVAALGMAFTKRHLLYKRITPVVFCLIAYVIYVTVIYLFEYQSLLYFVWGIRNNIRFFIAFLAFVYFLNKDDVSMCLKFIDVLFVAHTLMVFFQFFVLGYKWDYLGGIFGVQLGCNGHSMILLIVVCIKSLLSYMHQKETFMTCILKCSMSLVIAAMSELKFFFVVFLIILIMASLITRFSFRKIILILGIAFAVFFSSNLFTAIWGEDSTLTFERVIELITAKNYSSAEDVGRFTAIPFISKTILTDTFHKLFGMGLGNCDTSAFAIFNTPFYRSHSYLNYDWFSSSFAFLETGYIGVLAYLSFFIVVLVCAVKLKRNNSDFELYSEISIIMSCICIALFFYNSSLRTDIAYIVYFILALPFISTTKDSVFQTSVSENRRIFAS